jgi:hypothetical protein
VGPDVPDVNMTTLTNAEFETQYDDLSRKFQENFQCIMYGHMNGITITKSVVESADLQYLFIHALSNETNRSYLSEEQILKMLSYA